MERPYRPRAIQLKEGNNNPILIYRSCTDIFRTNYGNKWVSAMTYDKQKQLYKIITK